MRHWHKARGFFRIAESAIFFVKNRKGTLAFGTSALPLTCHAKFLMLTNHELLFLLDPKILFRHPVVVVRTPFEIQLYAPGGCFLNRLIGKLPPIEWIG